LTSLITDDSLLVRLFIQKLKLSFGPEKPESQRIEDMKQNLQREKEIMDQLAEIEQQNAMNAVNAGQSKKAEKPPAKAAKNA
jgi:hypothetical protein